MPEQDTQYPDTWPGVQGREQKPGMYIKGKAVGVREFKNRQGQDRLGVDIQTPEGQILSVPAWHYSLYQVLKEMGERGELVYGTELTIEFEGEKRLSSGNTLKLYKVNGQSSATGGGGSAPPWFGSGQQAVPQTAPPVAVGASADSSLSAVVDDDPLPF